MQSKYADIGMNFNQNRLSGTDIYKENGMVGDSAQAEPSQTHLRLGLKFSNKPELLQAKRTFGLSLAWLDNF